MTTDIFIRTYHKDLEWLGYALASIHKHVTGYRNIIVTIPVGQGHLLSHLTAEKVIEVEDLDDGYLGQQLTKMEAWKYTDADCVMFWDSDVIAMEPIDVRTEYFKDGKPILYKTRYSSLDGCPWQGITEKALGLMITCEYMRRMPIMHTKDVLIGCGSYMQRHHGISLQEYMRIQPIRAFSEFNIIGAFAERYWDGSYTILDTEAIDMPPNKVFQGWSWGGITPEVLAKLKEAGL